MTPAEFTMSPPAKPLPPGACDSHAHVFGPYQRFPLGGERSYTPPEADAVLHRAMLDRLGFERAVIVQPTVYGYDPACILDAVALDPANRRAVGVAGGDVSPNMLAQWAAAGMAGLRFVEIDSQRYGGRPKGSSGFAELVAIAPIMREAGLHAQLFAKTEVLADWMERLLALDIPLVLDHMAAAGPSAVTPNDPRLDAILGPLRERRIWIKLPVIRRSSQAPHYEDARPFHDAFLAANPDRMLWGTDWPLVNLPDPPDIGKLIDLFDAWNGDDEVRRRIFVDNPAELYGFQPRPR
ncbi:MAG: amidohydrolase [Sphingobium sp.]